MSWINSELENGEQLIYETRPHWSLFAPGLPLLLLGFMEWLLLLPAVLVVFYNSYKYFSTTYFATNRRLIQKRGLYYIRFNDWSYTKIDNVIYTQSIGDRLWKRGSLILLGMAMSKTKLEGISKPKQLRNVIQSQLPTTN